MPDEPSTPDPRSGIDPRTGEWAPAFEGQRPPLEPGHTVTVRHGVYASVLLTPRANEIAEWLRSLADHLTQADEPALRLLAQTLAHFERASGVLGDVDHVFELGDNVDVYLGRLESRARLSNDARRWADSARKLMHELGLTPAGRAELEDRQLTVVHVHEVQVVLGAWNRAAAEFVPYSRRAAFLSALDEALRSALPDVVLELPAVEEPPAREHKGG